MAVAPTAATHTTARTIHRCPATAAVNASTRPRSTPINGYLIRSREEQRRASARASRLRSPGGGLPLYPSLKDVRFRSTQRGVEPSPAAGSTDLDVPRHRWWRPAVSANVVYLGLTSMFTDISSEMVNSVIPLFLTFQLGFSHFQLGLFNGAYTGIAAFAALGGATLADRYRRYKAVAGVGYGVSAGTRIGLTMASNSWLSATGMLYADRAAKGVRTAPRDALISLSSKPGRLAESFGVHRAFDTLGALAGPFVAFALLAAVPGGCSTVFRSSFWIALVGLLVLVLFVQDRGPTDAKARRRISLSTAFRLLQMPRFRRLVIAGGLLSAVTIADAFVYLTFQQRTSMSIRFFPLLYAGTATAYVLLAIPLGRLADRVGPARVFICGQALLIGVDAVLLQSDPRSWSLLLMLGALGVYYAATDGVLAAAASSQLPLESRASGLALMGVVMALTQLLASTVFGALWSWRGPGFAVGVFLSGLCFAIVVSFCLILPLLVGPEIVNPSIP